VLVEDREHPDGATAHRGVGDKVPRPHVVPMRGRGWQTCGNSTSNEFPLRRRHAQSFRASEALDMPLAHWPAFSPQQHCDPPIPVSRIFQRQLLQAFP